MHPGVFAAKEPERPAVIMGAAGPVVTYAELEARSNQVAWLARRCRLLPGDGLAVIMENRPELLEAAFGEHPDIPGHWLRELLGKPGSVGRPLMGTAHVVGFDGAELPPGEIGTIWFEGGTRSEYHRDPDKTAAAANERGWRTVGDVGYLDRDGYLYLTDRDSNLIISGGVNISVPVAVWGSSVITKPLPPPAG